MNHPTPLPFAFRSPSFRMGRSGGFPSRSRRLGGGGGGEGSPAAVPSPLPPEEEEEAKGGGAAASCPRPPSGPVLPPGRPPLPNQCGGAGAAPP